MKYLLFKILISAFMLTLIGCSSSASRENTPEQFDLLNSGVIKQVNILQFKDCLIKGFEVRNRIAYNITTRQQVRTDGHRVESYGGEFFLLLSVDILNTGETQLLRVKNSELSDLSKQISTYATCLAKYK